MKRDDAIGILQKHANDLRARGVRHAALFGSVVRGEAGPGSDVDIMIELDPNTKIGIFRYAGIRRYIAALFADRVDVVDRNSVKPHVRPSAERDAIYAF
jgi:uncharacterized protein